MPSHAVRRMSAPRAGQRPARHSRGSGPLGATLRIPGSRAALWLALAGCLPTAAQAGVFICRDAHGSTVTTDHLSADCLQYGGKELNTDGSVRRLILTQSQQQQEQAAQSRNREAAEQALQEQRQQRALLARYPNGAVLRESEESDLRSVQALIDAAHARLQVLARERAHLDEDAQFYPSGNYPNDLRSRMQMNQQEREQEQKLVASQQREMQRIRARYSALQAQLRVLWTRQHAAEASQAPAR